MPAETSPRYWSFLVPPMEFDVITVLSRVAFELLLFLELLLTLGLLDASAEV